MPMSAEERDLIDLQTELLRQSQDSINSGNALNELLMPIILEEAGYTVQYGDMDVRNPAYDKLVTRKRRWEEFVNREGGKNTINPDAQKGLKIIEEINAKLKNTPKTLKEQGITGLTKAEDPAGDLREQNERLLLERQNAALRGELPVAPALLSDLDQQEEDLRASLLENLGTGYETSTPGIEALAKFGESKNAILEATRRDDIATAGRLGNEMGGFLESLAASRTGRATGAGQIPFASASNLAQISQGYGGVGQQLYQNRALDFQIDQANNSPGLLESLVYQGAGTASTFGLAKLFF